MGLSQDDSRAPTPEPALSHDLTHASFPVYDGHVNQSTTG